MSNRYLTTTLRRALEKTAKEARIVAEDGARDAIRRLGVADSKAPSYLSDDEKQLRRRLRAHARALGDAFGKSDDTQEVKRLVEAAAYAHWHRMLFTRFLAERGLLRNPEYDVPVSLEDCRELAEAEGATDAWAIAERYAAAMLPAVFRIDDPVLALQLDPVHTQKLHRLVTGLDAETFQAEDSLGWTYQFWRAAEKDAVNASGVKIGADELPAVTQLFTEPYMVRFLLHNTIGAWWAGKVLAANPALARTAVDEEALRSACSLPDYRFEMLRFVRDGENASWRPSAGTFPGWPKAAKEITMLDPCCGSGHFLTEALMILTALRQSEDNLSSAEAVAAVLRDNLHGLEIDGRCVQIAAFSVALCAWRIGRWQVLPQPHIAWVGAPPPLPRRQFLSLANGDPELEHALGALHELFMQAPVLGTLLEIQGVDLFETEKLRKLELLLEPALQKAQSVDPEKVEGLVAARGMADAARMLRNKFTIQATNVPFLGKGKQCTELSEYIKNHFPAATADLANAIISRMVGLSAAGGSICCVSPHNWLFLTTYKVFRQDLLAKTTPSIIVGLGKKSFELNPTWDFPISLTVFNIVADQSGTKYYGVDVSAGGTPLEKCELLASSVMTLASIRKSANDTDMRITLEELTNGTLLAERAGSFVGFQNGDAPRWVLSFWEVSSFGSRWATYQLTTSATTLFDGRTAILKWDGGNGELVASPQSYVKGKEAWGKVGVIVRQIGNLPCSLYFGDLYDQASTAIIPKSVTDAGPIWAYVSSDEFNIEVRKLDQKLNVTNATLSKVPFDRKRWATIFQEQYPDGLPEPYSEDATQWIFHGHPRCCLKGTTLHVALCRLAGYRWPAELDSTMRLSEKSRALISETMLLPIGDNDGLLGIPPVAGEKSLAERLRTFLAATFGTEWSDILERRLISETDELLDKKAARDSSLEAWLRDRAFRQHCALFGQRPFLWHISDGLKDGFSVFVHYHRFDQANLRKLTYTLLGDWLARAKAEDNALRYEKGRELQQMLEKVLEGEKPNDIFVRWKSLAHQPLGWDPDLDDGVRQNIRPFIKAGVLTHDLSKILKDKDRGNDVASAPWYSVFNGERRNDHHTTLADKRAAREAATVHSEGAK